MFAGDQCERGAAAACSMSCRVRAATLTAIAAGPSTKPAMPMGSRPARGRPRRGRRRSCARNRAHFERGPMSRSSRGVGAQRRLDDREVLDVVVRHDEHVLAGGEIGERGLGHGEMRRTRTVATASPSTPLAPGARYARPRASRPGSRRGGGRVSWRARTRASSSPTWPRPKRATDGTTRTGSSSMVTSSAALHAVLGRRPVAQREREQLRLRGASASIAARGRSRSPRGAAADRAEQRSGETTIFAPPLRGACPRTIARVTITEASARRGALARPPTSPRRSPASGDSVRQRAVVRSRRPRGLERAARRRSPGTRPRASPASRARRSGRRAERRNRLADRLADAEREHQRRLADGLRAVDHAVFRASSKGAR